MRGIRLQGELSSLSSTWVFLGLLGFGLLAVDTWASVIFIQNVPGALQGRDVVAYDKLMAFFVSFAMTASQLTFWLFLRGSAGQMSKWAILAFAVPGVFLNVFSNFLLMIGGDPSPGATALLGSVREGLKGFGSDQLETLLVIFVCCLSFLVSFMPEFLVDWALQQLGEGRHTRRR